MSFHNNKNYAKMSGILKGKLVMSSLGIQYEKFFYYFNDLISNNFSEISMIRKFLVSLNCTIYFDGDNIITAGQEFK